MSTPDLRATKALVLREAMTADERDALVAFVQAHGEARRGNHRDFNSIDYVCGAMAVMFALGWQDRIPAQWIFGPMVGNDPLNGKPFPEAES